MRDSTSRSWTGAWTETAVVAVLAFDSDPLRPASTLNSSASPFSLTSACSLCRAVTNDSTQLLNSSRETWRKLSGETPARVNHAQLHDVFYRNMIVSVKL